MLHLISSLKGYRLDSLDGDIGSVRDVYFDCHEWTVRYLIVNTGSWLLGQEVLISPHALGRIDVAKESIHVDLTYEKIKNAPDIDTQRPVSRQQETAYYNYYGYAPYWGGYMPMIGMGMGMNMGTPAYATMPPPGSPEDLDHRQQRQDIDYHLRSVHDVTGHTICGSDDEIGRVGDFLVDDSDWSIRYFIVDTSIWFGKEVVVPTSVIREVSWNTRTVYLTIPRERVKNAPEYDPSAPRIEAYEHQLDEYYGTLVGHV